MTVTSVQLGSPRRAGEGLRIGTVRRPPRGVNRSEYATRDYYDVWLPELAPSEPLRAWVMARPITEHRWNTFVRRYRTEMAAPTAARLLTLLGALARTTNFSVGCYCDDESRCHRSVLIDLLRSGGGRRRAKKGD